LMVQVPDGLTVLPQVLVCEKSAAFVPVKLMLLIARLVVPLLVRVTAFTALLVPTTWLLKVMVLGSRVTVKFVPLPFRETLCVPIKVLSEKLMFAVRVPLLTGEKVTVTEHRALTERVLGEIGQVLVCQKSPVLEPLRAILLRYSGPEP